MKKNPIIFIAMLIALAFTSCQMNTDDSVVTPPAPTYKITVTATNGTVTLSKTEAKAGETITVTETNPENGYEFDLGKVTIKDANGNALSVDATTKSFVMPASNVTITVEFVKTDGGNPTTPTTDDGEGNNGGENNGNVVYGSKRIILPTVEHGTIKITNKSGTKAYKDGNTVLSNAGADAGDVIEIKLVPDTGYNYFAYENTLTVTSIGSVTLTKSDDTTYTFEMPNHNVTVNSVIFDTDHTVSSNLPITFSDILGTSNSVQSRTCSPGLRIYVMVYGKTLISFEGFDSGIMLTSLDVTSDVINTKTASDVTGKVKVKLGENEVLVPEKKLSACKFYSFIMPRNDVSLNFEQ